MVIAQVVTKPDVYRDAHASHWKWSVRVSQSTAKNDIDDTFSDELVYTYDVVAFDAEQAREAAMLRHVVSMDDFGGNYVGVINFLEKEERLAATLAQIAYMCNGTPMNANRRDKVRDIANLALKEMK